MACAALAAGVGVGLTGCVVKQAPNGATTDAAAHREKLTSIVYINPLPADPLWDRVGTCMASLAAQHGIRLQQVGPPGGNADIQSLENLDSQAIANHAQAIVTWSQGAPGAFDALFGQARAAGIPVVTLISSGATHNQTVDIGTYPADFARLQIDAVARRPGIQRLGVLAQGQHGPGYDDYVRGLKQAVAQHPNVKLEAIAYDQGIFTDDLALASSLLTAHPAINGIVNYSGFTGVLTAIKEKHDIGKVFAVISSDFPQAAKGYIDQGLVAGVRVVPSCHIGRLAVQSLIALASGQPVKAHYDEGDRIVSGPAFERLAAQGEL